MVALGCAALVFVCASIFDLGSGLLSFSLLSSFLKVSSCFLFPVAAPFFGFFAFGSGFDPAAGVEAVALAEGEQG